MSNQKTTVGADDHQLTHVVLPYGSVRFDGQAERYDQRVGLRERDCRQIVRAVLKLAEVHSGDVVVEVGVGTGQLGHWFPREGQRYIGFDLSQGMLAMFRRRVDPSSDPWLVSQADGNRSWPIADATAHVIFSSRAIHLLALDHVVHEVFRVANAEHAALIIGRVQRQHDSMNACMKQELHRRLRHHGVQGHDGEQNQRRLLEACCEHGAQMLDSLVVSRWTVASTPWQSIHNWQTKPGLGGVNLPASLKQEILKELELWAEATFNGLQQPVESEEAYVLQGVRLHPFQ